MLQKRANPTNNAVNMRLPAQLIALIDKVAEEETRTRSGLVHHAIVLYLRAKGVLPNDS